MSALNYIKSSPRSLILDFFFFLIFAILFLDKFLGTLQFYLKLYNHIFFLTYRSDESYLVIR